VYNEFYITPQICNCAIKNWYIQAR